MVRLARGLVLTVVSLAVLATAALPEAVKAASSADGPAARLIRVAQKKLAKKKTRPKKAMDSEDAATPAETDPAAKKTDAKKGDAKKGDAKKAMTEETAKPSAEAAPAKTAAGDDALVFSRDIAPILVANCGNCHITPPKKRGDFDMSTFKKLIDGTKGGKVIEPGNPDESDLLYRVKGGDAQRKKMPPGARNNLAEVATDKIEKWIKAGALLDAGKDPNALIASYAASPEEIRRLSLAKMTSEERDKHVESVGLDRWKKASPKTAAEVHVGKHFILFSALPKTRAGAAIKKMDDQFDAVRAVVGKDALEWGEKGSLFVFNDTNSYSEFVQAIENRQIDAGDSGTSRVTVAEPYVAVIDPMGGRDGPEPLASASKKASRPKKGKSASGDDATHEGPERSLAGLLTEHFVSGAATGKGKPPRWLTQGLGALIASHVEPGSPYYRKIRHAAHEAATQGWQSKANDALGDQETVDLVRAVGFAILDWIQANNRAAIPALVHAMQEGGGNLDEALNKVFGMSRQDFLTGSGEFVMSRYGR